LEAVPGIVEAAASVGYSVISGGALGVDVAAHRAALERGVPQTVVLPLGRDRPYPPRHGPLFATISKTRGCGVVHAQRPGTVPSRGMFASRNRIVVELSRAVLVVQAGVRSGTIGTGRLGLRAGRGVGVLRGSGGAAQLAAEGARWIGAVDAGLDDITVATKGWLEELAGLTVPDDDAPAVVVPQHLRPVLTLAQRAGRRGIMADECDAPMLALAQLAEAEALGLLVQVSPGRYVSAI